MITSLIPLNTPPWCIDVNDPDVIDLITKLNTVYQDFEQLSEDDQVKYNDLHKRIVARNSYVNEEIDFIVILEHANACIEGYYLIIDDTFPKDQYLKAILAVDKDPNNIKAAQYLFKKQLELTKAVANSDDLPDQSFLKEPVKVNSNVGTFINIKVKYDDEEDIVIERAIIKIHPMARILRLPSPQETCENLEPEAVVASIQSLNNLEEDITSSGDF